MTEAENEARSFTSTRGNERKQEDIMAKKHIISKVLSNSIAAEMEIEAGDALLMINGNEILDVFDYHFLENQEFLEIVVEKSNGELWELEIEKDDTEELGMVFSRNLMDEYKSCQNRCIFCFIDQMPKGMRETLYFKDDDSRLSFLQGNYVTLTNMREEDLQRIVKYRLEPINISFHTTNPALRCRMLNNATAGEVLKKVEILHQGRISMNGQIVLCKNVNDKNELERSLTDLSKFYPYLQSVSVVPAGLTRYRQDLYPLEPFTKEDAKEVLEIIKNWQTIMYKSHNNYFVYGADEWYYLAEEEVPEELCYDDYPQLENGVGMVRLLMDEVEESLASHSGDLRKREISIATGILAAPYIGRLLEQIKLKFPNIHCHLYPVQNHFFGEQVTVSGLLTGQDILEQLRGKPLGEKLLLPCNMLKADEDVFLDDISVCDLERALQVAVDIVKSSGQDFVFSVLGCR